MGFSVAAGPRTVCSGGRVAHFLGHLVFYVFNCFWEVYRFSKVSPCIDRQILRRVHPKSSGDIGAHDIRIFVQPYSLAEIAPGNIHSWKQQWNCIECCSQSKQRINCGSLCAHIMILWYYDIMILWCYDNMILWCWAIRILQYDDAIIC